MGERPLQPGNEEQVLFETGAGLEIKNSTRPMTYRTEYSRDLGVPGTRIPVHSRSLPGHVSRAHMDPPVPGEVRDAGHQRTHPLPLAETRGQQQFRHRSICQLPTGSTDDPISRGEVGVTGVAISTLETWRLFTNALRLTALCPLHPPAGLCGDPGHAVLRGREAGPRWTA